MKHTPGPWFMTGELPGYRHRINNTPQNLGWDLAHVCNGPEADANARLIAAAPDLITALCLAHGYLAGNGWDNDPRMIPICDAIRKATGDD